MLASLLPLQQRLYATCQITRLAALPLRGSLRALQKSMASTEMKGRKRQIEQQVVASSLETGEAEALVEKTNTEVTKPAAKTTRTKRVAIERVLYTAELRAPELDGPAVRLLTWNVASLRSSLKKDSEAISRLVREEQADVVCLQETKLKDSDVEACEKILRPILPGFHMYWNNSIARKGYSGTAIFSRVEPLSVSMGLSIEEHDQEGRVITAEYPDFYVVNAYVPNAGEGLKRLEYRLNAWDTAFSGHLASLGKQKPVILTGDLNCAPQPIDIHNPKRNLRSAGFTPEERESFERLLIGKGFRDVFRERHPDVEAYTYWNYLAKGRGRNGWRIDFFLMQEALADRVHDAYHLPHIMALADLELEDESLAQNAAVKCT